MKWRRSSNQVISRNSVEEALAHIKLPNGKEQLGDSGRISEIAIDGGTVSLALKVSTDEAQAFEPVRLAAEKAVRALPGIKGANVVLTAHRASGGGPSRRRAEVHTHRAHGARAAQAPRGSGPLAGIADVKSLIAVASGKGGVGKSTVAVNLAVSMVREGKRVGLLDGDIYGPSVPRLVGVREKPEPSGTEGRLKPLEAHGLKLMSIGFLVNEDSPMIWRGPMVQSALVQMLRDVDWGSLDVLVIDMPPGTGDAQLTLAQQTPLAGSVIVSTPQDIALIDARKAIAMFEKVRVPILGLVENMSHFICPHCGERSEIFGHGGARKEAARLGVPFLGEVPLHGEIRMTSDDGRPVALGDGPLGEAFAGVARAVLASLGDVGRPAPKLVIQ